MLLSIPNLMLLLTFSMSCLKYMINCNTAPNQLCAVPNDYFQFPMWYKPFSQKYPINLVRDLLPLLSISNIMLLSKQIGWVAYSQYTKILHYSQPITYMCGPTICTYSFQCGWQSGKGPPSLHMLLSTSILMPSSKAIDELLRVKILTLHYSQPCKRCPKMSTYSFQCGISPSHGSTEAIW